MKKIIAIVAFSATLPLSGMALAQDFPGWSYRDVCGANDSLCVRFEQHARGQVSGVWETLPPGIRSSCVSETEAIEKSFRLLYNCVANKMQEHMRGQSQRS